MTVVRKIYNEAHPAHMDENVIDLYKEIAPDMPNLIFFQRRL